MNTAFHYETAFARNIGWFKPQEQELLRNKRIAIAGLGGGGGVHLLTLARLGVANFNIADFDHFDIHNFNRQVGASMSTVGLPKIEVMEKAALDINPEMDIKKFPEGISKDNIQEFLEGCDLYLDGLDFFAFEARAMVFSECERLGIPVVTAAPVGMGTAIMCFRPGGMSFEKYFAWANCSDEEKGLRLAIGIAPSGMHRRYLVERSAVNMLERRVPSLGLSCQICSGMAAAEVVKILLGRGRVRYAPHGLNFDAYLGRVVHTWRPWGNRNPLHKLILVIARRQLKKSAAAQHKIQPGFGMQI